MKNKYKNIAYTNRVTPGMATSLAGARASQV